ncbi:phage tail assembly chaperone [Aurantimonas coralicida]|uniref:phage tail assembly chaperone n=1 Tax=Aurantimonas coralicida TaxID=182270 RepID=UPI001E3A3662|nr:hypothetical protein [Aurantimonas coralicida]MCD1645247.1 hypothetical protein [Aurantimonas coralicida]
MAEKKIGPRGSERTFKVEPLLIIASLNLKFRLAKILGPGMERLPSILGGLSGDEVVKLRANEEAIRAITAILSTLEPEDATDLVKEVVEIAKVKRASGDYDPVDLEGDFQGREADIIPVMLFVLKEQFADFFSGVQEIGRQKAAVYKA